MCKKLLIFLVVLGFVSSATATHPEGMLFEWWFDIGGVNVGDLTGQADFPDNPDSGEIRMAFDGPLDWLDNYGTRAHGYLHPTDDGAYT
ncbi:MAG: hypothetical protein ACYS3S_23815, partial [Planctomycetota bacterium]